MMQMWSPGLISRRAAGRAFVGGAERGGGGQQQEQDGRSAAGVTSARPQRPVAS